MARYVNPPPVSFEFAGKTIPRAGMVERLGVLEVAWPGVVTDDMKAQRKVTIGGKLYRIDKLERSYHVRGVDMVRMELTALTA